MYNNSLSIFIGAMAVSAALFPAAKGGPTPGVTEVTRTVSCCGKLEVPIAQGCENEFVIGQTTVALVTDTEAAEGMTQTMDCVDFTHVIVCDAETSRLTEKRIYHHLTPCSM